MLTSPQPGDQVRVIAGTFVGMQGQVVSFNDARAINESFGPSKPIPTMVCVLLSIFGRTAPVALDISMIEVA
jgi:transcription antitermination factor NusG